LLLHSLEQWRKIGAKKQGEGFLRASYVRNTLSLLVRPERFELPAVGFEVRRSIRLSYGRVFVS
jgi:hypothetical protein